MIESNTAKATDIHQHSGPTTQSTSNHPAGEPTSMNLPVSKPISIDAPVDLSARHKRNSAHLWFWQADNSTWRPFEADASDTIETRFSNNPTDKVRVRIHNQVIEVDLASLKQTNLTAGGQHSVKRVPPLKSAATSDPNESDYVWQWETDEHIWNEYGSGSNFPTSMAIEAAYASDRRGTIHFHSHRCSYVIDVGQMKQTNETTGKERELRRHRRGTRDAAQSDMSIYPSTWIEMSDGEDLMFPLSPTGETAQEFKRIADEIALTFNYVTLTSIKRIQNNSLYQRFHFYKTQMEKRLGRGEGTWHLFHGPNAKSVDAICKQGFDFRLNSKSLYGKGSYFARHAKYASEYTDCNKLFMAQVRSWFR